MKKFSKLLEKQKSEITEFDKKNIEKLLKEHGEIDIIVRGGQRYFIAPHMHKDGKLEEQGAGLSALNKDGDKIQINFSDIVGVEF